MPENPIEIVLEEPFLYIEFSAVANAYNFQRILVGRVLQDEKSYSDGVFVVFDGNGENDTPMKASTGGQTYRIERDQLSGKVVTLRCFFKHLKSHSLAAQYWPSRLLEEPKIRRDDHVFKTMEIGSEDANDHDNDDAILTIQIAKAIDCHQVEISILQGRNLVPKDRKFGLVGKKTTSDPYVVVNKMEGRISDQKVKTKVVPKTLDPVWNETLVVMTNLEATLSDIGLCLLDHDTASSDDPMGTVVVPASSVVDVTNHPGTPLLEACWYPVQTGVKGSKHYCHNATGEIQVLVTTRKIMQNSGQQSYNNSPLVPTMVNQSDNVAVNAVDNAAFDGVPSIFRPS